MSDAGRRTRDFVTLLLAKAQDIFRPRICWILRRRTKHASGKVIARNEANCRVPCVARDEASTSGSAFPCLQCGLDSGVPEDLERIYTKMCRAFDVGVDHTVDHDLSNHAEVLPPHAHYCILHSHCSLKKRFNRARLTRQQIEGASAPT